MIKVLLVEDDPSDAELAERELRKGGLEPSCVRVEAEGEYLSALDGFDPDIVISDYSLPSFDGMRALVAGRKRRPDLPFIVLTGALNEETAVECMKAGASDYVLKDHMARLPFAVKEALGRAELRREAEAKARELRSSEAMYRSLFYESNVAMLITDPERFVVVDANEAAAEFYGWRREELIGKSVREINTLDVDSVKQKMASVVERKRTVFEFRHMKSDGTVTDVEVRSGPISIGGRTCLFSMIHDSTARIEAERARDAAASRLSHYLSTSPTISYSLRLEGGSAKVAWVSENVTRILGYTVGEVMEPDWWFKHVYPADRPQLRSGLSELTKQDSIEKEYRLLRKDRTVGWFRDILRMGDNGGDGGGFEIVGTLIDISGAKGLEDELRLKGAALEAADTAIVITDRSGAVEWANLAFERLSGYSKDEYSGVKLKGLIGSGSQDRAFYRGLMDTISSGEVWHGILVNKRKSGESYTEEMTITPVLGEHGAIAHYVAIKQDVTERIRSETLLKRSLEEREVLLREVHHRVKNNMQVISSLINLSARALGDEAARETLDDVSRRIHAIATVHELFYDSDDLKRIDFRRYLESLALSAMETYDMDRRRLRLSFGVESLSLDLERAIPAGLIASEMLNASLRELRGSGSRGMLSVALDRTGEDVTIELANGIGSGSSADPLSRTLADTLALQLKGSVAWRTGDGPSSAFRFPAE